MSSQKKEKIRNGIIILAVLFVACCALFIIPAIRTAIKTNSMKKEYQALLDKNISDFRTSDEYDKHNVTSFEYTLTDFKKSRKKTYDGQDVFVATVVVECSCPASSMNGLPSELEECIPGRFLDDVLYSSTGDVLTLRDPDTKSKYKGDQLFITVNGEQYYAPEARDGKTIGKPKKDESGKTCPVCGRHFDTFSGDGQSIVFNGMCKQCTKNLETGLEMKEEMSGN